MFETPMGELKAVPFFLGKQINGLIARNHKITSFFWGDQKNPNVI